MLLLRSRKCAFVAHFGYNTVFGPSCGHKRMKKHNSFANIFLWACSSFFWTHSIRQTVSLAFQILCWLYSAAGKIFDDSSEYLLENRHVSNVILWFIRIISDRKNTLTAILWSSTDVLWMENQLHFLSAELFSSFI